MQDTGEARGQPLGTVNRSGPKLLGALDRVPDEAGLSPPTPLLSTYLSSCRVHVHVAGHEHLSEAESGLFPVDVSLCRPDSSIGPALSEWKMRKASLLLLGLVAHLTTLAFAQTPVTIFGNTAPDVVTESGTSSGNLILATKFKLLKNGYITSAR